MTYIGSKGQKMDKHINVFFYRAGFILLGIYVLVALVMRFYWPAGIHLPKSGCIFQVILGMYCPGCGGTRAVLAFLQGRILQSVWYHPLILYGVVFYLLFMVSQTAVRVFPRCKGMRFRAWYLYGALVLTGMNFILKNVLKLCFDIYMI